MHYTRRMVQTSDFPPCQWSDSQRAFVPHFKSCTLAEEESRYGTLHRRRGMLATRFWIVVRPGDRILLDEIECSQPSRGLGGRALEWFCAVAHASGQSVILQACPLEGSNPDLPLADRTKLRAWYERHGFVHEPFTPYMIRRPA